MLTFILREQQSSRIHGLLDTEHIDLTIAHSLY